MKKPITPLQGFFLTLMEDLGLDSKFRDNFEVKERSGLKIGDVVILKPESAIRLYDGCQLYKEQYKDIHINNRTGVIVDLRLLNDHYSCGEYANVEWENGFKSNSINTSWLKISENDK